jgi:hypothetical protein
VAGGTSASGNLDRTSNRPKWGRTAVTRWTHEERSLSTHHCRSPTVRASGTVFPARNPFLFYSPLRCSSRPTRRAKTCAGRHDFEDYTKIILTGSEHLTRPLSPGSPAQKHRGCIGPYGSLRCPASVARRSRERPDFVPPHPGVSRKSSSRSQVLARACRHDAAKTGYQSHSADGRPKRAALAAIPMDGGSPR